jgi:hypothetical protein
LTDVFSRVPFSKWLQFGTDTIQQMNTTECPVPLLLGKLIFLDAKVDVIAKQRLSARNKATFSSFEPNLCQSSQETLEQRRRTVWGWKGQ